MATNEFGPIAIVSFAGRFPGANSPEELWQRVVKKNPAVQTVPANRWIAPPETFLNANGGTPTPDRTYSYKMCLLSPSATSPEGLPIDAAEAAQLDPLFRLVLRVGSEAWQGCKTDVLTPERVAVVLASIALPTDASSALTRERIGRRLEHQVLGTDNTPSSLMGQTTDPRNTRVVGYPAMLLRDTLGLAGTAYTLDAACASSLYAVRHACDLLNENRADAVLAGGASRPDALYTQMGFCQLKALSPTGVCAPFDENANGLVVGEGCGIVVLKRLADALRDGDTIQGVIRAVGTSCDIEGSLLSPASEGQLRAMRQAYAMAGLTPDTIDYIECHGTGTPVGDAEEVNSYCILWKELSDNKTHLGNKCVLGSVKATVGHMLTGAGMGGLATSLQAIRHKTLPPIATFRTPAGRCRLQEAPVRVLTQPEPWERHPETPRRAGISAFGFGGINAHLILEEFDPAIHTAKFGAITPKDTTKPPAVAVIGMALRVGKAATTQDAQATVLSGNTTTLVGAIPKVSVPHGRYRIPPKELEEILPQQLIMLETAREALVSAKASLRARRPRASVFIGQSLDQNTNNYQVRWTAHALRKNWEKLLGHPMSGADLDKICNAVCPPLNSVRVLGSLGNIIANRIAKELQFGGGSFTVSAEEESGTVALNLAVQALRRGELDLAIAGAVDLPCDGRIAQTMTGKPTDAAVAMVLKRHEDAVRDGDNILAIIEDRPTDEPCDYVELTRTAPMLPIVGRPLCAVGKATELWCGAATEMLGFAKAVTAINRQIIPAGNPNFVPTTDAQTSYSVQKPHYWHRNRAQGPRWAQVRCAHAVYTLCDGDTPQPTANPLGNTAALFAVGGQSPKELIALLEKLRAEQPKSKSLAQFALAWHERAPLTAEQPHALAIVTSTAKGLHQGIQHAISTVELGQRCTDQHGVFYTPTPCSSADSLCFVYPGSGNHYPGVGTDTAANWPVVSHGIDMQCRRLKDQLRPDLTMPYQPALLGELNHNAIALLTSHVAHAGMMTALLQSIGIAPRRVLSYSLGESACYFAMGVWSERDEMLERMERGTLFTHDLYGSFDAVRKTWNLSPNTPIQWTVALFAKDAETIQPILSDFPHVYLLLKNAPEECVLGGLREEIEAIAARIGATALYIDGITAAHCEVVEQVRDAYWQLHYFEKTTPPDNVRFYSSALSSEIALTSQTCADSITAHAVHGFDFTKIVRQAYDDGARAFVEIGPGASCTRMINKILGDRPYCAVSACKPGEDGVTTIMSIAATLVTERAMNDLRPLLTSLLPPAIETAQPGTSATTLNTHIPFNFQSLKLDGVQQPQPVAPVDPVTPTVQSPPKPTLPSAQQQPAMPAPLPQAMPTPNSIDVAPILDIILGMANTQNKLHQQFMELTAASTQLLAQAKQMEQNGVIPVALPTVSAAPTRHPSDALAQFNYDACMEFAIGKIGNVLGPDFASIDAHPTRVRLPDDPLMLCHRIMSIEGTPKSMGAGRCITEHDVVPNAWYLDGGVAPVCISVEAGQADLFLCAYLGIDFKTKGQRVYRLLDATIHCHRGLPRPGETIRYDITIDRFIRQGDTWLFFFWYDGTINGEPFLTMRNGCAGFFTHAEVENSGGLILGDPIPVQLADITWHAPVPITTDEHYSEKQIDALRTGNLGACFGESFAAIPYHGTPFLPSGKMRLVHRVVNLQPNGGRYNAGLIRAEADIHPNDWFLTCHFVDDMVMPGTLMYECCAHTLRIFLMRMGWIGNPAKVCFEPVAMEPTKLKCRGPVLQNTKIVTYEIHIQQMGFNPAPYAICEAIMYADGHPIIHFDNMTMQIPGASRDEFSALWASIAPAQSAAQQVKLIGNTPLPAPGAQLTELFDRASILAYAEGNPSEGFGEPYTIFDPGNPEGRILARLPRPPYLLMDRVTQIHDGKQWDVTAGIWIESQFDVKPNDWYFRSNNQTMPFCVILEIALQPCGWVCAYLGCALRSTIDLKFRNLGGTATLYREVTPADAPGTLTMRTKLTKLNEAGGMMIVNFETQVWLGTEIVYDCVTEFGFFTAAALATQLGVRGADKRRHKADLSAPPVMLPQYAPRTPWEDNVERAPALEQPSKALLMIDRIDRCDVSGAPKGFGYVHGTKIVDEEEWLFYAHFYQDPVCPGSLGLESFLQLLKHYIMTAFPELAATHRFEPIAVGAEQQWVYRGQIITANKQVEVDAVITSVQQSPDGSVLITADGFLSADSLVIYEMKHFAMRAKPKETES